MTHYPGAAVLLAAAAINVACSSGGSASASAKATADTRAEELSASSVRTVLYAAVGAELTQYDVDVENATLVRRDSIRLPANVQEAALHPSRRHLYVGWSNRGASAGDPGATAAAAANHGLTAFKVDAASGALTQDGPAAPLRSRPIHLTTDVSGAHVLVAYNDPSGVSVHRIQPDGTIGAEITQPSPLDAGIYGHQVRVLPSNRAVVLVTRGNAPTASRPEDPGALKVFTYQSGVLKNQASIAPNGGYGFQSRHLDFHPSRPWAFLTLERQNKMEVYRVSEDSLGSPALFSKTTLSESGNVRPGQTTSTIHVHPNGRFVYVGNRASATREVQGRQVSVGGENTIAVFAINQDTGEPTLVQTADTHGFHPRTFALDGSGRLLVVGNLTPIAVRDGNGIRTVPAGLSVFRIGTDGKLAFVRQYSVDADPAAGRSLWWMGIVSMD
jgi:6-phosphogluconolactonase (cycloisomerase 2 family)